MCVLGGGVAAECVCVYSSLQRCVLPIMNLSSNLSRPPSLAGFHQSTDTDSVLH